MPALQHLALVPRGVPMPQQLATAWQQMGSPAALVVHMPDSTEWSVVREELRFEACNDVLGQQLSTLLFSEANYLERYRHHKPAAGLVMPGGAASDVSDIASSSSSSDVCSSGSSDDGSSGGSDAGASGGSDVGASGDEGSPDPDAAPPAGSGRDGAPDAALESDAEGDESDSLCGDYAALQNDDDGAPHWLGPDDV